MLTTVMAFHNIKYNILFYIMQSRIFFSIHKERKLMKWTEVENSQEECVYKRSTVCRGTFD